MTSAYYLSGRHDVTVFEASDYIGGHTNTIEFEYEGRDYAVDTGFIVFNDRTYPNFCRLLDEISVTAKPTRMTFSLHCDQTGLEYRGADLGGLFAQRRNLIRPQFYFLLYEMLRFNRSAERLLLTMDPDISVREFFERHPFGRLFREKFFLPMASAIWSCPNETVEVFPMRFIVEFYKHHGLLSVTDRPQWYVIDGGSQRYMEALVQKCAAKILLNQAVLTVRRDSEKVTIVTSAQTEAFDHVIFACHSDQALALLKEEATTVEREVLGAFPYEKNVAVLHADVSVLPRRRRAWACWNYHLPVAASAKATVTYNMNLLQGLTGEHTFCVTLNSEQPIDPSRVIRSIEYHHPVFTVDRRQMQGRHGELLGLNRSSFCGAYWGNGFHEDGVVSALAVCKNLDSESCTVASMRDGSGTGVSSPGTMPSALQSV
jgi:predicted NAD/FAD-binding protein